MMANGPILVQKFGGTSVSTPERRQQAVAHVARARVEGQQVAIVVSAMGRRGDPYATDTLLDLLRGEGCPVDPADYDLMFACGETISVAVMSQALKRAGIRAIGLTSAQAGIFTDGHHVEAEIREVETTRLLSLMAGGCVPVVTGGQGVARGTLDFTTLGRGGSDTSGVALGAALHAHRVDIFTDVEGVATIDPRLVPGARILTRISYASMHELARFGAKVVHPRAIETGRIHQTPIAIRSTFTDGPGTVIADVDDELSITGLALLRGMRTVALPEACLDAAALADWERRRLISSITDAVSGERLLAAPADKLADLDRSLEEKGLSPVRDASVCSWVTMVGKPSAVSQQVEAWLRALVGQRIEVLGHEVAGGRATFVVPDVAAERAACLLYECAFAAC